MAKQVGYLTNFQNEQESQEAFSDGPFVVVNVMNWGFWRVECERKNYRCSICVDKSIWDLLATWKIFRTDFSFLFEAEKVCDRLNEEVKIGNIILEDDYWIWKGSDKRGN